jgi:hypothetical protein
VDYIRVGAGVITLGYDGGFGSASVSVPGGINTEALIAPTLQNSWENFGSGYVNAGYYKNAFGEVTVFATLKNGVTADGTVIFTLPVGYRPATRFISVGYKNGGACRIDVDNSGQVGIYDGAGAGTYLAINFKFRV